MYEYYCSVCSCPSSTRQGKYQICGCGSVVHEFTAEQTEKWKCAIEEEQKLRQVRPEQRRTMGIMSVSTAALYYKSGEFQKAKCIAREFLGKDIPNFAREQLNEIIDLVEKLKS